MRQDQITGPMLKLSQERLDLLERLEAEKKTRDFWDSMGHAATVWIEWAYTKKQRPYFVISSEPQ